MLIKKGLKDGLAFIRKLQLKTKISITIHIIDLTINVF